MLVLSRAVDESLILETSDGKIVIKIVDVRAGKKVRLGISAPLSVMISRAEILKDTEVSGRGNSG